VNIGTTGGTTVAETSTAVTAQLRLQRLQDRSSHAYYDNTKELAAVALKAFKDRRPMRSLEALAFRARSPVDVFTFVKSQTGKEGKKDQGWRHDDFGTRLLTALEELQADAKSIVQDVFGSAEGAQGEEWLMEVHLGLIRLYVRHLVSHYLYARSPEEDEE
jgi:hypothetical protein